MRERHEAWWTRGSSRIARWGRAIASDGRGRGILVLVVLAGIWLSSCGGASQGSSVVRVGGVSLGKGTVAHWAGVFRRGGAPEVPEAERRGTPTQRALAFLISSAWLTGEARREGLEASDRAVEQALSGRREANGGAEFDEGLRAAGKTIADVKLEVGAGLALNAIRTRLSRRSAQISQAEIVDFYTHNRHMFVIPEVRDAELIEKLASPAAAIALVRRIGTGPRFARMALHESVHRRIGSIPNPPDIEKVTEAIFAAPLGKVSRPMKLNRAWTVFVVRKARPPALAPLSEVRGKVVQRLTQLRTQSIATKFVQEYEARWKAKTSCRRGYVVQGCAQYTGLPAGKKDLFFSAA